MNAKDIMSTTDISQNETRASHGQGWTSLLLLGLIVWFMVSAAYHSTFNPGAMFNGQGDFKFIYSGAHWFALGQTIYRFHPTGATYVYPPMLAVLLRPLGLMTIDHAAHCWFLIETGCLLLGIALYAAAAKISWRDAAPLSIIVIVSFKFWPTVMSQSLGTANLVLLLALCALYLAESRGKMRTFAVCVGLAATVKTWMLGAVIYLLVRRAWRAAALCIGSFVAFMIALFTIIGWKEWPMFFRLNSGYLNQSIGTNIASQSISGFARMYFRPNLLIQPLVNSSLLYYAFIGIGSFIILAGLVYLWRLGPAQSPLESRVRLGFIMLSVLLLSPFCQPEYFVLCLPLLWTLLAPSADDRARLPVPAIAVGLLIYFLYTRGGPYYLPMPEHYQHGPASLRVATQFYGAVALWCTALYTIRSLRSQKQRRDEHEPQVVLAGPPKQAFH